MHMPRVMSTQHPDNVEMPFFARQGYFDGEDEIREAYYVFSHLGMDEQMWDFEGKEVDDFVVKKLLSSYPEFFRDIRLGEEIRITPRIPNPTVEREEAKLLSETLEMIPRSYDYAREFYGDDAPYPISEVILPMVTSIKELERVYWYYRNLIAGKSKMRLPDGSLIGEWLGEFEPEELSVIPLFEDIETMISCHRIVEKFADGKFSAMRVFLARSDPALNFGFITATLAAKIALMNLDEIDVEVYPIIGVGCPPFRGFFDPENLAALYEYPSVQTFTAQSAFKYDHSFETVRKAVEAIRERNRRRAQEVDIDTGILERLSEEYRKKIPLVADLVNEMSRFIPRRRMRKLHIGLFGYSRGDKIKLPRAISFCCSLYSIGLPPEVIGFSAVTDRIYEVLCESIPSFEMQMESVIKFLNKNSLKLIPLEDDVNNLLQYFDFEPDHDYTPLTEKVMETLSRQNGIQDAIIQAAKHRKFLG